VGQNFQLSGDLVLERSADPLDGVLAGAGRTATAPVDLNGDGLDELVIVADRPNGNVGIRVIRRDPSNPNNNVQIGDYEWTNDAPFRPSDIAVAAADLDGSTDGKEEIVIAMRYSGSIRVFALSGDAAGNIQQSNNATLAFRSVFPSIPFTSSSYLRLATGDVLLEGRDQVILYYDGRFSVLRAEGSAVGSDPFMTFSSQSFLEQQTPGEQCGAEPQLSIGNFGGSAAEEIVVTGKDSQVICNSANIDQTVFYFTTDRDEDNQIIDYSINDTPRNIVGDSNVSFFQAVGGEMDRRPGDELVLAFQPHNSSELRVEMFRVDFDASGLPTGIGASVPQARATVDLGTQGIPFDIALGDAEGDAIGDVYVTARVDSNGDEVPGLFKFSMTRPADPNQFPDVSTFDLVDSVVIPSLISVDPARTNEIQVADWDNDSVLGDLGTDCVRVREPLIRTVVKLPPYWERLQATTPGSGFNAAIGQTRSGGSTEEQKYDTFSGSDISGYVGVQAGGDVFGIGIKTTVKATAGRNEQSRTGEVRTETVSGATTQTQAQTSGQGLLVLEENTYDCYSYNVVQNGADVEESFLRACQLIRLSASGDELRSFIASDLDTWETEIGAGTGGNTPAQWAPFQPDWASLSLFRPTSTNTSSARGSAAEQVVDGLFDTALVASETDRPYVEIDLGELREITSIRVFPQSGQAASLIGFNLYASRQPFSGDALPAGPGVDIFPPDPATSNGVDRWTIRTRGESPAFEPLLARFIRLQHPETAALGIAEIQVFGDVYLEPPLYPLSVCDPIANDGIFLARVTDLVAPTPQYRNVQVRGDLSWSGRAPDPECGSNHDGLPDGIGPGDNFGPIWNNIEVSGTGIDEWDFEQSSQSAYGETNQVSHSSRAGAEIDIEVGAVVAVAAYSFETGVSRENATTKFWGESLQYSGAVPGFNIEGVDGAGCGYRPQPYSYVTTERANSGYIHKFTVIDYVVRETSWSRLGPNFPPSNCFNRTDSLFKDRFEPAFR
jgi:hypothetical protein